MSKKNQPQTMHKVPATFAEEIEKHFSVDSDSAIGQLAEAARSGAEVSRKLIEKGLRCLEEGYEYEALECAKGGEDVPKKTTATFKRATRMLKNAIAGKPESTTITLSINASFREFAALKVPGGRDKFSSMRLPKLLDAIALVGITQEQVLDLWDERNKKDGGKNYAFTEKELASVLRWHLRGLSVEAAVRKVRVDLEIALNAIR